MIRPRSNRRRDWPSGLREPRPGYFTWRSPDGKEMAIGRVSLNHAKEEARQANEYVLAQKPSLLERLTGSANTIADLLDKMPSGTKGNTIRARKSLDKKIRDALGALPCHALTVKHCADLIEAEIAEGRSWSSQALRSRLVAVCKRGQQLGWLEHNPAEPTQNIEPKAARSRMTLEQFLAIREKAPEVQDWLAGAMNLALITGQDRSTLSELREAHIGAEYVRFKRVKTGVEIEVPLALRQDAIGMTLDEAIKAVRPKVRALKFDYLICHSHTRGGVVRGAKVDPARISKAFAEARDLAGITGDAPPTFHEIRSLSKRLYLKQGGVDTRALLGHKDERTADLYANPRGIEAIRVAFEPVTKPEEGKKNGPVHGL